MNLDADWIGRKALPGLARAVLWVGGRLWSGLIGGGLAAGRGLLAGVYRLHGPEGVFARTWSTGNIVLAAALVLGGYLILYYWR